MRHQNSRQWHATLDETTFIFFSDQNLFSKKFKRYSKKKKKLFTTWKVECFLTHLGPESLGLFPVLPCGSLQQPLAERPSPVLGKVVRVLEGPAARLAFVLRRGRWRGWSHGISLLFHAWIYILSVSSQVNVTFIFSTADYSIKLLVLNLYLNKKKLL